MKLASANQSSSIILSGRTKIKLIHLGTAEERWMSLRLLKSLMTTHRIQCSVDSMF